VSGDFMPHGHCYLWDTGLVRLHLVTDALIWLSYVSISVTLAYLVYRSRRDMPFHWMFLAFGLFIIACGFTHFMEIVTLWKPVYWMSGYVKLITAVASVATALALPPVVPRVLAMLASAKVSEERRKRVESVNKELESFSYSISHDLRAPLRSIEGFTQIIIEDHGDKLDEEGRGNLERVRAAARRMAGLIDDILTLSRMTRSEMRLQEVDLSAMAREIVFELRRLHPARKAEVVIQEGLTVKGDAHLLRAVLENLVGNAWKFTREREKASITFGARRTGKGETTYFVQDNGAGFNMAHTAKLFSPFQRLHGPEYDGSGVGLAAVQRAVQRHGGRVWADGTVGEGAVFFFTLNGDTST
jgi:light-regulated signal transduction histidine kinase (bacteriophytochrome)